MKRRLLALLMCVTIIVTSLQAFQEDPIAANASEAATGAVSETDTESSEITDTYAGYGYVPNYQRMDSETEYTKVESTTEETNKVKVAILDSGINTKYGTELNGGVSFVDDPAYDQDANGHGTVMAATFTDQVTSILENGMSGVELYSVKILDENETGTYDSLIKGIQWSIDNGMNMIIVSSDGDYSTRELSNVIEKAVEQGILIIAAAGNKGMEEAGYPARYSSVLSVGAIGEDNERLDISNYGEDVDLYANGNTVSLINQLDIQGTSVAAQRIAGIAACVLEQYKELTNVEIINILVSMYNENGDVKYQDIVNAIESGDYSSEIKTKVKEYDQDSENSQDTLEIKGAACTHPTYTTTTVKAATCTAAGTLKYTCKTCGVSWTAATAALGHNYTLYHTIVEPTCTETGVKQRECTRCGGIFTHGKAALGHNMVFYSSTVANCTTPATTTTKCSRCSVTSTTSSGSVDSSNHSWGQYVTTKQPTCTTEGMKIRICSRCSEQDKVTLYGSHSMAFYSSTQGTCGTNAIITYKCSYCSYTTQTTGSMDPSNHASPFTSDYATGSTFSYCDGTTHYNYKTYYCYCRNGVLSTLIGQTACNCHKHSYTLSYGTHTAAGHLRTYTCACGSSYTSGYTALGTCLSCTTPASAFITNINANTILSETDIAVPVSIYVQDNENDTLTCNYFIDDATTASGTLTVSGTKAGKEVSFASAINTAVLSEGSHTIKLEAIDPIAPKKSVTVTFVVDKSAPIISNVLANTTTNSASFQITAVDSYSSVNGYRYNLGSLEGDWLESNYAEIVSLIPNTSYAYQLFLRDTVGHITTQQGNITTKVDKPDITITAAGTSSISLTIQDGNATDTGYYISVGNFYATSSGQLGTTQQVVQLPLNVEGKRELTIYGLASETEYNIVVTAISKSELNASRSSDEYSVTTKKEIIVHVPLPAAVVSGSAISINSIAIEWESVEKATGYDIEVDGTIYNVGSSISYMHLGLEAGSLHEYRVRARNSYVRGEWSTTMTILTPVALPDVPGNLRASVTGSSLSIATVSGSAISGSVLIVAWDNTEGADGYEIEINGIIITDIYSSLFEYYFNTESESCTSFLLRVRAKNSSGVSDWSVPYTISAEQNGSGNIISNFDLKEIIPKIVTVGRYSSTILWDSDPAVLFYRVELNGVLIYEGSRNRITLTGLLPETGYYLSITAYSTETMSNASILVITNSEENMNEDVRIDRQLGINEDTEFNGIEGEELRILIPTEELASNSRYTFTISWNSADITLIDEWEPTSEAETTTCSMDDISRSFIVEEANGKTYLTVIWETTGEKKQGIAASILVRCNTTGEISFHYEA